MFVTSVNYALHPNILKTGVLLVTERKLGFRSPVLRELDKLKLNSKSNAVVEISDVFRRCNISDSAIIEILNETSSLILSLDNPEDIAGEYIYSNVVRLDIDRKVKNFNNNKNSYDLNAILNLFKGFVLKYSISKYDWESEGLKEYLGHTYTNFFSRHNRFTPAIKEILNNRGSVTKGNDGDISLSDKATIESDSRNSYKIDFSSVVKDVSIASDRLFNISNVIVYDLYSFYRDETIANSSKQIKDLFISCFGSLEFSPTIREKVTTFDTKYTENTVYIRKLILRKIYNNVNNGLFSYNVYGLYDEIKSVDIDTLGSRNVATLFKYPTPNMSQSKIETIEKHNRELFLEILKGVKSLTEFIKYLKFNNKEFSDYNLFRDLSNYKKYSTLESYLSIKDLSTEIGNSIDSQVEFNLPYYSNDNLYDVLSSRFNLSSLSSIYNEQLSRLYSTPSRTEEFRRRLLDFINVTIPVKAQIEVTIDAIKSLGEDVTTPEAFECFLSEVPSMVDLILMYFEEGSSTYFFKNALLESKNIYNILRFFDFSLIVYDHLLKLVDLVDLPDYNLLVSGRLHSLDYPSDISDMSDLTRLDTTRFKLSFYELSDKMDDENMRKSVVKVYSVILNVLRKHLEDITQFIDTRVAEIDKSIGDYGIIVVKNVTFSNNKLRGKLMNLKDQPDNPLPKFVEFRNGFKSINGLLSEDGLPIVYDSYLVHEKGYFLSLASDFSISKITDMQIFDLNKVKPWRDVLWKV